MNPRELADLAMVFGLSEEATEKLCHSLQNAELQLLDWLRPGLRAAASTAKPGSVEARAFGLYIMLLRIMLRDFAVKLLPAAWGEQYTQRIEVLAPGLLEHPGWELFREALVAVAGSIRGEHQLAQGFKSNPRQGAKQVYKECRQEEREEQARSQAGGGAGGGGASAGTQPEPAQVAAEDACSQHPHSGAPPTPTSGTFQPDRPGHRGLPCAQLQHGFAVAEDRSGVRGQHLS